MRAGVSAEADANEFLAADGAVVVDVELLDHGPEFVLLESLAEFTRHALQVLEGDSPFPFHVKELEGALDLVAWVAGADALGHLSGADT